ncbi:DoxX family protein [Solicola gregarius]|uniref:DoxX family protein n=1 Tax=Solicola gregarius TaxID=2908642 RepID=A0AA46TIH1_9ACTN|nr:DoxX family protein [Solicola gregarius]UYM05947.1 DoxX family protein [Solicola gregarius]
MWATYVTNSMLLAAVLGGAGAAKLVSAPPVVAQANRLGYTARTFRFVGLLEVSAAVGLLLGLAWMPIGAASAIGLVVLLALAARAHLRSGDPIFRALPPCALAAVAVLTVVAAVVSGH